MAVLRTSQGMQAPQVDKPQVQQSRAGAASPDTNKFLKNAPAWESIAPAPPTVTMNNVRAEVPAKMALVGALFGVAEKYADTRAQMELEDTYLRGVAAYTSGLAEAEIQANPLTRDWAVAGYRDTAGKMRMAEAEAQTMQLIKDMAERPPAEFQQALEARRQSLLPQFQGMSRDQRSAALAQVLASDQAAIQKHAMAHGQFIVDQKQRGVHVLLSTQAEMMNAAKGTPGATQATDSYIVSLLANTVQDRSLPAEFQQSWLAEGIAYAIQSGNPQVYEAMASGRMEFTDGTEGTPVSRLPLEVQSRLGTLYRNALKGMGNESAVAWQRGLAQIKANYEDPLSELPTPAEFAAFMDQGRAIGGHSGSEASEWTQYYKAYGKRQRVGAAAEWYRTGDTNSLVQAGLTPEEGAKAFSDDLKRRGMPPAERIRAELLTAADQNQLAGFSRAGSEIAPFFRGLGLPGEGGPTQAEGEVIAAVVDTLNTLRDNGNNVALAQLLEGMSPEDARIANTHIANLRRFGTAEEAATATRSALEYNRNADKTVRDAAELNVEQYITEFQDKLDPYGIWGMATRGFPLKGAAGQAADALAPQGGVLFGGDPAGVAEETARVKSLVAQEFVELARQNPFEIHNRAEDLWSEAMANVSRRTVEHQDGRLYLNQGQNIRDLFGVPAAVARSGKSVIGTALSEYADANIKGDLGGRVVWTPAANGQNSLTYTHYSEDGQAIAHGVVPATEIGRIATQIDADQAKAIDELLITGKTVQRPGGQVRFNGQSSTPVEPDLMFKLRETLIKNEDVRDTAYLDTRGVLTVGVGVAKTSGMLPAGLKAGDKVDQAFIDSSFQATTDEAAQKAWDLMRNTGAKGEATFLLLAEMAYQSGNIGSQQAVLELLGAIQSGQAVTAHNLLEKTNAYKYAGESRKQHYAAMVRRAAQGM